MAEAWVLPQLSHACLFARAGLRLEPCAVFLFVSYLRRPLLVASVIESTRVACWHVLGVFYHFLLEWLLFDASGMPSTGRGGPRGLQSWPSTSGDFALSNSFGRSVQLELSSCIHSTGCPWQGTWNGTVTAHCSSCLVNEEESRPLCHKLALAWKRQAVRGVPLRFPVVTCRHLHT